MPPEVKKLQDLLSTVSDTQIPHRKRFVEATNKLLRASGYRCLLEDGTLALLWLDAPPRAPGGYIRFQKPTGGSGRLGKTKILGLARIPPEHGIPRMAVPMASPTT